VAARLEAWFTQQTGLESGHTRHLILRAVWARQEKAMVEEKNKKKDFAFRPAAAHSDRLLRGKAKENKGK
jgi:hypothetical protein